MHINSIITEIEEEFKSYKDSGLLDKASLYRWALLAIKRFGQAVLDKTEKFIEIRDGIGNIPDNFHSLHYAIYCKPKGYSCNKCDEKVLQNSLMWKERTERKSEWNSCEPCCKEESETIITENVYLNDCEISFYYSNPIPLRLSNHINREYCAKDCKNYGLKSPYEISIKNLKLHTNFSDGTVYIQYYGIETNEDGTFEVPDSPRGDLAIFIETHLKRKIIETVLVNGDDKNLGNLLQYYTQQEALHRAAAVRDVRYMTLTPRSYAKLANMNRKNIKKYEVLLPKNIY